MYEVKLYITQDIYYVKVDKDDLDIILDGLNNDTAPNFIEVYYPDSDAVFAINREMVSAYTYVEVSE